MKFFWIAVIIAVFVNIYHPYLWGPDEPREIEIAREIAVSGNYVTPEFCGRPFLEKPPLYYDIIAVLFKIMPSDPGVARAVSALFALAMILCVWFFTKKFFGLRCAVFSCAILLIMPQFYRGGHWILLDIAVGAFCTISLCAFAFYVFADKNDNAKRTKQIALAFFYGSLGCAFLTKGIITLFYIALICGFYILVFRRFQLIRDFLMNPMILLFILPVGGWILLFYLDGGYLYLHEHFINNTIGRLLHIDMTLEHGREIFISDVGNSSPWYFYLERSFSMFGVATIIIPASFYFLWKMYAKKDTAKSQDNIGLCDKRGIFVYLMIWTFLLPLVLSFSSIKEVTYILPSYASLAILGGFLCARYIPENDSFAEGKGGILFLIPVGVCAVGAETVARLNMTGMYIILSCILLGLIVVSGIILIVKKRYDCAFMTFAGILLGALIIANTPSVMRNTRLDKKCMYEFAPYVWDVVKSRELHVSGGDETLRGSLAFYGNRDIVYHRNNETLHDVLSDSNSAIILSLRRFEKLSANVELTETIGKCRKIYPDFPRLVTQYVILLP